MPVRLDKLVTQTTARTIEIPAGAVAQKIEVREPSQVLLWRGVGTCDLSFEARFTNFVDVPAVPLEINVPAGTVFYLRATGAPLITVRMIISPRRD